MDQCMDRIWETKILVRQPSRNAVDDTQRAVEVSVIRASYFGDSGAFWGDFVLCTSRDFFALWHGMMWLQPCYLKPPHRSTSMAMELIPMIRKVTNDPDTWVTLGYWLPTPYTTIEHGTTFHSNYTPFTIHSTIMGTYQPPNDPYLHLSTAGQQTSRFHRQLWMDLNPQFQPNPQQHVHHLNGDTTDNRSINLEAMRARAHLALHGVEGGRPRGRGRR